MKKTEQAKKLIAEIENETKEYFRASEIVAESGRLGLYYQDVSAWMHGHRRWSVEKVLKVAVKVGI